MTRARPVRRTASPEDRAESLKERIYVTFTSLAVVLALQTHAAETTPGGAAATLLIAVVGTLLAVFVADFLSHLTVHAVMPNGAEFRHMVAVSVGAIGVVFAPLIFLGLAALDVWPTTRALRVSVVVLIATLAVVGYLAVRRLQLPTGQKIIVLFAEVALGLAVVGLELLAHE